MAFQPCVPICIIRYLVEMLATIDFNDQFLLKADQIYDIWSKRLLPAELMPSHLPAA